jgi:hypothetical protein
MTPKWDVRVDLLEFTHRWPLAILAFLVGGILGLVVSFIFPTSYAAETTLFVAYNADAIFRNPDDYKNWHMGELNALIVTPDVIQETHDRLRQIDPYWENVSTEELKASLNVYWRNTGKWRLVVESDTAQHASQALEIWEDVFLETYQRASEAAFNMTTLRRQIEDMNAAQAEARTRAAVLMSVKGGIQAWVESVTLLPDDQPVDSIVRWQLWSLAARAAGYDPAWDALLKSFPAPGAILNDYITWLEQAIVSLDVAIETLESQIESIESERMDIEPLYQSALQESRGLSSMIHVERGSNSPPDTSPLRQTGLAALVGGLIGLMAWTIIGLVPISIKAVK